MNSTGTKDHDDDKFVDKNSFKIEMVKNGNAADSEPQKPATESRRRWFVVMASFICNGIVFGLLNSVSVIYDDLKKNLESEGVDNAAAKACE